MATWRTIRVDELLQPAEKRIMIPFVADAYLDRRRPEWSKYEDQAMVLYVRQPGEPQPLVYVRRECRDVLKVLEGNDARDATRSA
jgi:hypothetical protein